MYALITKIVIEYDHNHNPQTNPWHHEDLPHNHETQGRQTKKSNQLKPLVQIS